MRDLKSNVLLQGELVISLFYFGSIGALRNPRKGKGGKLDLQNEENERKERWVYTYFTLRDRSSRLRRSKWREKEEGRRGWREEYSCR